MTRLSVVGGLAAPIVGLLLLTGCGSAGEPGVGGSATAVVPSGATDGGPGYPTEIGSAPPTAEFTDRAAVVAAAVRQAGVPTAPTGPEFLNLAPDLGFETSEQKVAWSAGKITFAPQVPADQVGTSAMTVGDGPARPVDIIGPRAAVDRALDRPFGDCSGVSPNACMLEIVTATLGRSTVATTEGAASVPVWTLTARGLTRPITVVAVAAGAAPRYSSPTSPAGIPDMVSGILGSDSLVSVSGSTITVRIAHGACDGDLRGHVVEFDDLVVVGATTTPAPPDTMCPAIALSTPTTLVLDRPLGDRPVIDIATGQPRFLGRPPW